MLYSDDELREMNAELENEMMEQGAARFLERVAAAKQAKRGGAAGLESQTTYGTALLREIIDPMARGLKNFIAMKRGRPGRTPEALDRLAEMDPYTVSYIGAKCILNTLSTGEKFVSLAMRIAQQITDDEYLSMLKSHNKKWYEAIEESLSKAGTTDYRHKINAFRNMGSKAGIAKTNDGYNCMAKMGDVIVNMFRIHTGYIELVKEYEIVGNKRKACTWVYPTKEASQFIEENIEAMKDLSPELGPICIKPKDWSTPFDGGYHNAELRQRAPMVRGRSKRQIQKLIKRGNFNYKAFNLLTQSAWRINNTVLDILLAEAEKDASATLAGSVAFKGYKCPLTPPDRKGLKPSLSKAVFKRWFDSLSQADQKLWNDWRTESRIAYRKDRTRLSQRRQLSTVIRMAQRVRHLEAIWFNYFLDFRGRAYAYGTMSPQGADFSKAVLQPAVAKALGSDGYMWMKLHISGVFGFDKATIDDRLAWVAERHEQLFAIADDPLGEGYDLWAKAGADKPYQYLAAAIEYRHVHSQLAMGIPLEHCVSRLVAAQDGSCNGTQHFSAMLKDEVGGAAVNLRSGNIKPNDIYGDVARETLKELEVVLPEHYQKACLLKDMGITRKTTKRQTMIMPYGGTINGCKEYSIEWVEDEYNSHKEAGDPKGIAARIEALVPDARSVEQCLTALGNYLGSLVWVALSRVMIGAVQAMKFVKKCARAVVMGEEDSDLGNLLEWSTPNGFWMVQNYKDKRPLEVDSKICGRISMTLQVPTNKIKSSKMLSSVSPNFVHSLDAAHMFCTLHMAWKEYGIEFFACIHDSFGTHCGLSTELAECIRHTFYEMYEYANPLRRFYLELLRQWRALENPKVKTFPAWEEIEEHFGSLNLQEVWDAQFFFL